jgi:hypothetical protein
MMNAMSPEELLGELAREHERFESYPELEQALSAVMRQNHDRVSAHVSADDVLYYAAQHGLVHRDGSKLVVAATASTASAV